MVPSNKVESHIICEFGDLHKLGRYRFSKTSYPVELKNFLHRKKLEILVVLQDDFREVGEVGDNDEFE